MIIVLQNNEIKIEYPVIFPMTDLFYKLKTNKFENSQNYNSIRFGNIERGLWKQVKKMWHHISSFG